MSANGKKVTESREAATQLLAKTKQLQIISQSRSRLMVCFYTLPLYMVALIILLNQGRSVTMFMFIYMAVYAVFAIDMVSKQCPACEKQFFVQTFFLNFITSKCVHCKISYRKNMNSDFEGNGRKF